MNKGLVSGMDDMNNMGDMGDMGDMDNLDMAINQVKSYIKNPKLVTPKTMKDLLMNLENYRDQEDSEPDEQNEPMPNKSHGLAILLGIPKGGGK